MDTNKLEGVDIEGSTILIVDDSKLMLKVTGECLEGEGFEVHTADSGDSALARVSDINPDLILLDIIMPGLDGYSVAQQLKKNEKTSGIPIIMVSALEDRQSILRGLAAGAAEYLTKPIDPGELCLRVRNMLKLKKLGDMLKKHNEALEDTVRQRTEQLENSFLATIEGLSKAAEYRDDETGAHVRRISYYSSSLAKAVGMDSSYCRTIFHASPMHDVGKIGTPDRILFKTGPLTDEEWEIMKRHTIDGAGILSTINSPYTEMGKEIALCHHERWDGSGYPYGIAGRAIPLSARIMSICDIYDALRSPRPYKKGFSHREAVQIILEGDGRTEPKHFDPDIHSAFAQCADEFQQAYSKATEEPIIENPIHFKRK